MHTLLTDACSIITLHELAFWPQVVRASAVTTTGEIAVTEAMRYERDGIETPIFFGAEVTIVEPAAACVQTFRSLFRPSYLAGFEGGEIGLLAFLWENRHQDGIRICSTDHSVPTLLGALGAGDLCLSLEDVLRPCGISRTWERHRSGCTTRFVGGCIQRGWEAAHQGRALRQ